MTPLTTDQAQTVLGFLLPQIESSRKLVRLAVAQLADDKLALKPVAEGESLGDLAWYITSACSVFLNGLADGRFPPPPAKPQPETVQAFLDWDEAQYPVALQRLANLDGEALQRPISLGHLTLPVVEFLPVFLSNIAQHLGMLMAWMAQNAATRAATPTLGQDELSDDELAAVAGGTTQYVQLASPSNTVNPNIQITAHYNAPSPIRIQTQAGLGALLGDGGGGLGAVGAVGGIAMIAGIWGSGVATLMAGGAAGGYTAGAAILMFLSRF